MTRGWKAPEAQWHGSALVRDTCLGCFAVSGRWPETARLLYPNGMPRPQVEQGEQARRTYLATGEWKRVNAKRRAVG